MNLTWRDKLSALNKGNLYPFPNSNIEICNIFDKLELSGYKIKFSNVANVYNRAKAVKKGVSIRFNLSPTNYRVHFFVMADTGGYTKISDSKWRNGGTTPTFDELLEKAEKHEIPEKIRDIDSDNEFVKPLIMRRAYRSSSKAAEFYYSDMLNSVETKSIVGVDGTKVNTEAVAIKDNDVWFLLLGKSRSGGAFWIISDGNKYRYVKTKYENKTWTATLTRNRKGDLTTNDQELVKCSIAWYVKCMKEQQEDK
jgi:hypothetical protein